MPRSAPVPSAEGELPAAFLAPLVAELDTPATVGILLGGSYARGTATVWSDVDLACFVADEGQVQPKRLFYRADRLVSVASKSLAGVRASLSRPQAAMWVVPGLVGCRILLDKEDTMAGLLAELRAFRWASVQAAADHYVGERLMLMVELVHKVIGGLVSDDAGRMARPVGELLSGLTR